MTDLLKQVEAFLKESGMTPTTFGKEAMKDPNFVPDLRGGREVRRRTYERAMRFIRAKAREEACCPEAAE